MLNLKNSEKLTETYTFDSEEVLELLGVDVIYKVGNNFMCKCPFSYNHKHEDRTPSFGFNADGFYNCLSGETKIITEDGVIPIKELSGQIINLLTKDGRWTKAPVLNFGKQPVMKVTLQRNKQIKEIYSTPNHRWLLRRRKEEVLTTELMPGDRLMYSIPRNLNLNKNKENKNHWISRGFVFGDGSYQNNRTVAYFCGDKDKDLIQYFKSFNKKIYSYKNRKQINGLPANFKELPNALELKYNLDKLYFWLSGYFAADGCVDKRGQVILSSSNKNHLMYVRDICNILGIGTFGITSQWRKGYGSVDTELFFLRFIRSSLTEDFFLIKEHKRRFTINKSDKSERVGWTVSLIEETDRIEDVYCAIVDKENCFTLEDNILIGNCFVCGSGSIYKLIEHQLSLSSDEAKVWLEEQQQKSPSSKKISVRENTKPIEYSLSVLNKWRKLHPYIYERSISKEVAIDHLIGYDDIHDGIVIPHIFKEKLLGWQIRHLDNCDICQANYNYIPKYKSSKSFPKKNTLYNYDNLINEKVIVVESPFSVLILESMGIKNVVATFGSWSIDQVKLLSPYQKGVILWPDNDSAGQKNIERVISMASKLYPVYIAPLIDKEGGDPADLTLEEIKTYLNNIYNPVEFRLRGLQTWSMINDN